MRFQPPIAMRYFLQSRVYRSPFLCLPPSRKRLMKHLECIDRPRLCRFPHSGRSKRRFNISQKGSPSLCGIVPVRSKKFQGFGMVFGNEMTVNHLPPHGRTFNDVQCPDPAWNISQIWNREIIRRNIASQRR